LVLCKLFEAYMNKQTAIDFFGSASALAKALGVSKSAVSQWDEQIPMRRQFEIEHVSGGVLRADYCGELVLTDDSLPAAASR